jgi:hypothetical protein
MMTYIFKSSIIFSTNMAKHGHWPIFYLMNVGFGSTRMESLFVGLSHNKPKKPVETAIVLECIIIFVYCMDQFVIFYYNQF